MIDARADNRSPRESLRDWLAVGRRHKRLGALCFALVFLVAAAVALLRPPRYQATAKLLVKHAWQDPLVTADSANTAVPVPSEVTDTELNSEIELIKSRDVLEKVVITSGLLDAAGRSDWHLHLSRAATSPQKLLADATRELGSRLKIAPPPKSDLISIEYQASNPQEAARVVNTLVDLYLEKHTAMQQPSDTLEFFQNQARQYEQELKQSESRLVDFNKQQGVASPDQQKTETLQKLSDFQANLQQTQASVEEIQQRIHNLETQSESLPSRMTTQVREADNPQLMEQMKSTLLSLQLKRTELLQKFEPSYRLVQEVDTEITQTQAAIQAAQRAKLTDETTDRNPTYEWVTSELARAKSELAAQQAGKEALLRSVRIYQEQAARLDQDAITEQGLLRDEKAKEANYLLYLKKQEEARISEELDRKRMLNVVVAEAAGIPTKPSGSRVLDLLVGFLGAVLASVSAIGAAEYLNPSLRTIEEVRECLDVPVLASISGRDR